MNSWKTNCIVVFLQPEIFRQFGCFEYFMEVFMEMLYIKLVDYIYIYIYIYIYLSSYAKRILATILHPYKVGDRLNFFYKVSYLKIAIG